MESNQFAAMVSARGCTGVNVPGQRRFVGTFAGYPFSTTFNKGSVGKTSVGFQFLTRRDFPIKQTLNQLKQIFGKQIKLFPAPQNQSTLGAIPRGAIAVMIALTVSDDILESAFDTTLRIITDVINATGTFVPDECPACRLPGCDSFGLNGIFYRPVHAACIQQQSTRTFTKVQQNEYTGSYGLGAIGALLGAIVGALPTILLMVLANRISMWLTAFIPWAAYFGYSKLRGKMTKLSVVFTTIASLLVAPVMLYIVYVIQIQMEWKLFLTPGDFFQAISLYSEVRADLFQTLLFTGLGILATLGVTLSGNKQSWNNAAAELASLRAIHPVQPQPDSPVSVGGASDSSGTVPGN